MKFKKLVALATATILSTSLLVGCSSSADENDGKLKVAMVTDVAGVNDQSFNQSAWEGLQKAEKDLGVEASYLESKQESDYSANIESLVDQDTDLIIGVGMKLAPAVKEASKMYPDQKFVIVEDSWEGLPKNVESILFNAQEASYLSGLVAGKMTKTNKVGFIGGMQIPVIETFQYGYMAGVKAANKDADIQVQYANSFTDQAKGKAIANQMYSTGVDTIFTAGGDVGTGAIESAKEQNKYAIGVDRDQNYLAPDNVITSAVKRVDVGVYNTVKNLVDGKFAGGETVVYGLKDKGVAIAETTSKNVPKDVIDFVNQQEEKIQNGELKVPATKAEYDAMNK
ncbi:BMP family lipoprotein [Paraclostridium bifermentans]|uniref:BMP family lipoprotein n=1 Tax=Paraclostridium bifermentans TaxID=1490 RepID=UPI00359C789E